MCGRRVVLVDSNQRWRKSSTQLLLSQGYDAVDFDGVREAWPYIRKYGADLVLANFNQIRPARSLWRRLIARLTPNHRAVLFVNRQSPDVVRECMMLGAHDCILRPLGEDALSAIVAESMPKGWDATLADQGEEGPRWRNCRTS